MPAGRAKTKPKTKLKTAEPTQPPLTRRSPGAAPWLAAALVVVPVAVLAPVRHFSFVTWDDPLYLTGNPVVSQGLTPAGVMWALTSPGRFYWHPLTWVSHMIDVQVFGMDAGAHHLVNLVLHVAGTLLLFVVLRRMTGRAGPSALVAALFAVHPLHVESVAWVAERKDVLSGVFLMLTLGAYVRYVESPSGARFAALEQAGRSAPPRGWRGSPRPGAGARVERPTRGGREGIARSYPVGGRPSSRVPRGLRVCAVPYG